MQRAIAKDSKKSNSLIELKAKKNAAGKGKKMEALKQLTKAELKKELAAGEAMLYQAQRNKFMTRIATYKAQVDYQVALEKKVNEILMDKATKRAAYLMSLKLHEIPPTDRKELGLMSQAELKKYAAVEKRMNEYLKEHEPYQVAAKEAQAKIYADVMESIHYSPHRLQRPVSREDMDYLIDTVGGSTLKQAKKELSMMQISKEDPVEFADRLVSAYETKRQMSMLQKASKKQDPEEEELLEESEVEPQENQMVERMENAASFANNIDRLRKSEWGTMLNSAFGNPVGKGRFGMDAFKAFSHKMNHRRERKEAEEEAAAAAAGEASEEPQA